MICAQLRFISDQSPMRTLAKNSDNEALVDYVEYVRNELNDYQVLLRSYLL